MKIGIADANIFIDIILLTLLDEFFSLPFEIWTTQSVLLELKDSQQALLESFSDNQLLTIQDEAIDDSLHFSRSLTIADQSILSLAHSYQVICLSGDLPVRKWCNKHQIEVHGILWIFDELISNEIITHQDALVHLTHLMSINDRLPEGDCLSRLSVWQDTTQK